MFVITFKDYMNWKRIINWIFKQITSKTHKVRGNMKSPKILSISCNGKKDFKSLTHLLSGFSTSAVSSLVRWELSEKAGKTKRTGDWLDRLAWLCWLASLSKEGAAAAAA